MASDRSGNGKSKTKNTPLDYDGKKKWSSRGELSARSSSTLEYPKKGANTMESYSDDEDDRNSSKKRRRLFNFSSKSKRERNGSGDLKKGKSKSKEGLNKDSGGSSSKLRASRSNTISELSVTQLQKRMSREVKPIFGVELEDAVKQSKCLDGIELPLVVRECLDHAEEVGLDTPGIYRISGIKSKIEALKTAYNEGRQVDLKEYDVTVVTGLLKQYLRELPEPVLTHELGSRFEEAAAVPNDNLRVEEFLSVFKELPSCNYTLLSWIMVHLIHVLDHAGENKMSIQNLSIVFSPTMHISHRVLYQLFTHWEVFFGHVKIIKCRKPLQLDPTGQVQLPDSVEELEGELQHHETMLSKMHEDLSKGIASTGTEEELWEVQRIVTQIKRKLRKAKSIAKQAAKTAQDEDKSDSIDQRSTDSKLDEESSTGTDDNKLNDPEKDIPEEKAPTDTKEPEKVVIQVEVTSKEAEVEPTAISPEEVKVEVPDEKPPTGEPEQETEEEESLEELYLFYSELMAKQDELYNIRAELQRRIEMERSEVERLRAEIEAAKTTTPKRRASENASDESSSDSEDDGDLQEILKKLLQDNERLKKDNAESSLLILQGREDCATLKAKITVETRRSDILKDLKDEQEKDKAKKETTTKEKGDPPAEKKDQKTEKKDSKKKRRAPQPNQKTEEGAKKSVAGEALGAGDSEC